MMAMLMMLYIPLVVEIPSELASTNGEQILHLREQYGIYDLKTLDPNLESPTNVCGVVGPYNAPWSL